MDKLTAIALAMATWSTFTIFDSRIPTAYDLYDRAAEFIASTDHHPESEPLVSPNDVSGDGGVIAEPDSEASE